MIPQEFTQDLKPQRQETLVWLEQHGGTFVRKEGPLWIFRFCEGGGSYYDVSFYHRALSVPQVLSILVSALNWPGHRAILDELHNRAVRL